MSINKKNYDDIIHLPHPVSKTHPRMSISDRAAQFAPFAALTGHDAAIKETARRTNRKIDLDENAKAILDEKLKIIQETLAEQPKITLTSFRPDNKKTGGQYVSISGNVKKIDMYRRSVIMTDGLIIPFSEILEIEGDLFGAAERGHPYL